MQSATVAQRFVEPAGQAPVTHVSEPPASPAVVQHVCPVAQSVVAPQTCVVPEAHEVWQELAAPAAPVQQTWPAAQSDVCMHGGITRHVMKPYAPPVCAWHAKPIGQSAFVAQVCRAPAGQLAMHPLTLLVPASTVAVSR